MFATCWAQAVISAIYFAFCLSQFPLNLCRKVLFIILFDLRAFAFYSEVLVTLTTLFNRSSREPAWGGLVSLSPDGGPHVP